MIYKFLIVTDGASHMLPTGKGKHPSKLSVTLSDRVQLHILPM